MATCTTTGLGSHVRRSRKPAAARPRHVRARVPPRLRGGRGAIRRRVHAERQLGRGEPPARPGHLAAKGRARRTGLHLESGVMTPSESQQVSMSEIFWYFLKLGWLAFGGPVGQIGLMHLQLVERRRWIVDQGAGTLSVAN